MSENILLNLNQIEFILTEFKDRLYKFYDDEIPLHTLGDSNFFETLESEVDIYLNDIKKIDGVTLSEQKVYEKLREWETVVFNKYNMNSIYFSSDSWSRLLEALIDT